MHRHALIFRQLRGAMYVAGFTQFFRVDWEDCLRLDCNAANGVARFWVAVIDGI